MVENNVKTDTLATCDPPCRIVQCAMVGVTVEVTETLNSTANLCQTVRQKWKAEFDHPLTPNTVVELAVLTNLRQAMDQHRFLLFDSGSRDEL